MVQQGRAMQSPKHMDTFRVPTSPLARCTSSCEHCHSRLLACCLSSCREQPPALLRVTATASICNQPGSKILRLLVLPAAGWHRVAFPATHAERDPGSGTSYMASAGFRSRVPGSDGWGRLRCSAWLSRDSPAKQHQQPEAGGCCTHQPLTRCC